MADYPELAYGMSAVRRAGKTLRGRIDADLDNSGRADAIEAFAIANSFRDSHVYPMRSVRFSMIMKMRRCKVAGITAARPKRMSSIRRKLSTSSVKLDQMNDLGGCRVICDDMGGVRSLIGEIGSDFPHEIRQQYPYIDEPKPDGYRSHHVVFNFHGKKGREAFDGRRIELQVRTRLQHSWATAVEAVGLFRGEDLKHGAGHCDWLRLFALTSAEFAETEGCPVADGLPGKRDRVRELKELNRRIRATSILDDIKSLTNFVENFEYDRGQYYLIRYRKDHRVRVEPFWSLTHGAVKLAEIERRVELGEEDEKVVLVEVDKIDKLVETYPNYFGDVSLFSRNLRRICDGLKAVEYSLIPQERVAPKPQAKPDPTLLRRRYTQWYPPEDITR